MDNKKILANLLKKAREKYPILNEGNMQQDVQYSYNPLNNPDKYGYLEYYSGTETGSPEHPRPETAQYGQPAVEIRSDQVTPDMVMGDVASHELINTDPIVSDHYRQFLESMTPEQREKQLQQYYWHQMNYNENRGFDKWRDMTGDSGYFRAYPFKQWGSDPKVYEKMYTPQQRNKLDSLVKYLKQPR